MGILRPRPTVGRIGLAVGVVVGFPVALLVFPLVLLAAEFVVGTVATVLDVVTEPRRGRSTP